MTLHFTDFAFDRDLRIPTSTQPMAALRTRCAKGGRIVRRWQPAEAGLTPFAVAQRSAIMRRRRDLRAA